MLCHCSRSHGWRMAELDLTQSVWLSVSMVCIVITIDLLWIWTWPLPQSGQDEVPWDPLAQRPDPGSYSQSQRSSGPGSRTGPLAGCLCSTCSGRSEAWRSRERQFKRGHFCLLSGLHQLKAQSFILWSKLCITANQLWGDYSYYIVPGRLSTFWPGPAGWQILFPPSCSLQGGGSCPMR